MAHRLVFQAVPARGTPTTGKMCACALGSCYGIPVPLLRTARAPAGVTTNGYERV
jgi:hypothetical protein